MYNDICLQCKQRPKRRDYTFCSPRCSRAAASNAPHLLKIPSDHVMYVHVASRFKNGWLSGSAPSVKAIYLVTWTNRSRADFDQYRAQVERRGHFVSKRKSPGNERKRFRGAARACTIGENGNTTMCYNSQCRLCETLRYGFGPYLASKRKNKVNGIRLGAGLYSTSDSSKASKYAVNTRYSNVRVMMLCRVVLGESYVTYKEHPTFMAPPAGYDSVFARPGYKSAFSTDERVVYNKRAIRPAYLIVY